MKKIVLFLYIIYATLLLTILTGCSSVGVSGSSSYYHHNSWEYDNYYRSGANRHYNRTDAKAKVRSKASTRSGGATRAVKSKGRRR